MAVILEMEKKRRSLAAKKAFQGWVRRFSEPFDEHTCLEDLSDRTLAVLIQPGQESSMAIYELILGVKGMGMGPRFYFLDSPDKMAITDISLFLLDQFRFEAMRRLEWVESYPTSRVPMVELVEQFPDRFSAIRHQTPSLSPSHPRYAEYKETFEGDQGAFIRRLIPDALKIFQEKE